MKSKDQQLLEEAYLKVIKEDDQFDPRLNRADYSNRRADTSARDEANYEASDRQQTSDLRNQERNAGLGPDDKDTKATSLDYAFKNDIIEKIKPGKPTKVFWVFAGPKLGEYSGERKFKDITSLIDSSSGLEGQEFQGKFNKFKIVRIEPSEKSIRHKQFPKAPLGAFYKAVPVK